MGNFKFLKDTDKNLYDIISEAEKLYRDEYFEQCISQTRRYAENLCKNVLGDKRTTERTFDDMLATLKDNATHSKQEKEFIDDLYFLKREGNNSVHSNKVQKDGIIALECLQRAFEVSINYIVYHKKGNSNILKRQYDIDLLITGKENKKTLKEKYETGQKLSKQKEKSKHKNKNKNKKINYPHKEKSQLFKFFLIVSFFISTVLALTIYILNLV
ncbi:DUF4145 domain-containing protein [bacterium]|nr:DUF4145 domain-containing protein [bacterium]